MKQKLLLFLALFFGLIINAQTVAYDATFINFDNTDCIDLFILNAKVKGHQIDVKVSYHPSLADAQNNTNELTRLYSYTSNNETVFARVTNTLNGTYATSQITIALNAFTCCPPPPNGQYQFDFCDVDNDGVETAYLNDLYQTEGRIYNAMLCGLSDSELTVTYHLSYQDAVDDLNPINAVLTFSEDTHIYSKVNNTVNTEVNIFDYILNITTCTSADNDGDGIDDAREDANRNANYLDDDTDNDGLKNYEDDDDDGDGILTINEDYNNNGNPLDDDTNSNGIADFLEANVTLSHVSFKDLEIKIFPNPVHNILNIELNSIEDASVLVIDLNGRAVLNTKYASNSKSINVTKLEAGVYFLKLHANNRMTTKKFIKK
ncbi:MAG: T9SS type A sorting domain-containing protein [Oceanihabitans sp.]|nr:T9SS type A sorting domain-containing protein [Oceanihabitans sp.]